MSKVFVKWTGRLTKINSVKSHAKYVGFRSTEKTEKGFFSKDDDRVDYKNFIHKIETNPALKHSKSVKAHKLVFSLRQVDYEAYKRSGKDYKDLVRATLRQYENKHGVKLDWIANIHEAEGHPHCHVIVKGVSDNKDMDGRYKRIYFNKDDFKELRDIFEKEFDKDVHYRPHEKLDIEKGFNDLSRVFESITKNIEYEAEKERVVSEVRDNFKVKNDMSDKQFEKERSRER